MVVHDDVCSPLFWSFSFELPSNELFRGRRWHSSMLLKFSSILLDSGKPSTCSSVNLASSSDSPPERMCGVFTGVLWRSRHAFWCTLSCEASLLPEHTFLLQPDRRRSSVRKSSDFLISSTSSSVGARSSPILVY